MIIMGSRIKVIGEFNVVICLSNPLNFSSMNSHLTLAVVIPSIKIKSKNLRIVRKKETHLGKSTLHFNNPISSSNVRRDITRWVEHEQKIPNNDPQQLYELQNKTKFCSL